MKRKLFCEISPFTYRLSMEKEILKRHVKDSFARICFARERTDESLPVLVYRHNSLIRRRLGNVDMQLQENKAVNLSLAVPHIDGVLIRLRMEAHRTNHSAERFSCWVDHRQGQTIGRHRRRVVPVVKPYPLDDAP